MLGGCHRGVGQSDSLDSVRGCHRGVGQSDRLDGVRGMP